MDQLCKDLSISRLAVALRGIQYFESKSCTGFRHGIEVNVSTILDFFHFLLFGGDCSFFSLDRHRNFSKYLKALEHNAFGWFIHKLMDDRVDKLAGIFRLERVRHNVLVKNNDPLQCTKSRQHNGIVTIIISSCAGSKPTRALNA